MSLDPVSVAKLWLLVKPAKRFKAWRTKRKMRSWADHARPADEFSEVFTNRESPVLRGKLTYASVAALALAWLAERYGVPVLSGEVEGLVTGVAAIVATVAGVYGRYRATKQ